MSLEFNESADLMGLERQLSSVDDDHITKQRNGHESGNIARGFKAKSTINLSRVQTFNLGDDRGLERGLSRSVAQLNVATNERPRAKSVAHLESDLPAKSAKVLPAEKANKNRKQSMIQIEKWFTQVFHPESATKDQPKLLPTKKLTIEPSINDVVKPSKHRKPVAPKPASQSSHFFFNS